MDTLVAGLSPHLDKHTWLSDKHFVFKDVRAFFREGVLRSFTPNLSAIAVTTCLRDIGCSADYLDLALEFGIPFTEESRRAQDERIADHLRSGRWCNLFISCVSSGEHLTLARLARIARRVRPDMIIGVGSYHAATMREHLLDEIPEIDFIFCGDLEPVAPELMVALRDRSFARLAELEQVVLRGAITPPGKLGKRASKRRSESRFDYACSSHYLKYYDSLAALGTKGCPFPCAFCQEKVVRRGYEKRDPAAVVDEAHQNLALYEQFCGDRNIAYGFMEPLFGLDKAWVAEFCDELVRRPLSVNWGFQTRVGQFDVAEIAMLARAGCGIIYYGLESFSPAMLSRMHKTNHPEIYLSQFDMDLAHADAHNILVEFNVLFGHPGETQDSLECNRRGIADTRTRCPDVSVNLNLFRPLPDTQSLIQGASDPGGSMLVRDWWTKPILPGTTVIVQPSDSVSPEDLLAFYGEMYGTDACYRRRGVSDFLQAFFDMGEIPKGSLELVGKTIRERVSGAFRIDQGARGISSQTQSLELEAR